MFWGIYGGVVSSNVSVHLNDIILEYHKGRREILIGCILFLSNASLWQVFKWNIYIVSAPKSKTIPVDFLKCNSI